jgi:hypothetical protein
MLRRSPTRLEISNATHIIETLDRTTDGASQTSKSAMNLTQSSAFNPKSYTQQRIMGGK